jgi:hypothetical protein
MHFYTGQWRTFAPALTIEPGIGDQLEAALLPKGDTDTRARIGLLEQMLIDICACSGVTLPRSIRERVGDLVDLSAKHDLGDFFWFRSCR